jgi:hypothetical protein
MAETKKHAQLSIVCNPLAAVRKNENRSLAGGSGLSEQSITDVQAKDIACQCPIVLPSFTTQSSCRLHLFDLCPNLGFNFTGQFGVVSEQFFHCIAALA